jgi:alkylation response protein AidB-like acyl-CoA dehydrogenase
VSGREAESQRLLVAAIPRSRAGIHVLQDWDNMGQRQTDSGSVDFQNVRASESEMLLTPGPLGSVYSGLRSLIAQLTLSNVYLGLAEGALLEARKHAQTSRRAVFAPESPGSSGQVIDPFVLHRFGRFSVSIAGARALADNAAIALQAAYSAESALQPSERASVATQVAAAKVASSQAALLVTSELFEVVGSRGTASKYNLDRFWRNARTHTLHDPLDHKLYELGLFAFNGQEPTPSFYS